jgi:hypothetical protein
MAFGKAGLNFIESEFAGKRADRAHLDQPENIRSLPTNDARSSNY